MNQMLFAHKLNMGQVWTKSGKRLPVTRLRVADNLVVGKKEEQRDGYAALQIGFGKKKLKNMSKPLRTILTKGGFSLGARQIKEVRMTEAMADVAVGSTLDAVDILNVGDMVDVQGTMKGRGFSGGMKRYGFHGGPKTHGQSDRSRAPGSIGSIGPARVLKGQRMAGHYGNVAMTVQNLQIVHIDGKANEVWVSGPVPGSINGIVRLKVTAHKEFEGLVYQTTEVAEPVVEEVAKPAESEVVAEAPAQVEEEKKS